jgi:hypothetical protein
VFAEISLSANTFGEVSKIRTSGGDLRRDPFASLARYSFMASLEISAMRKTAALLLAAFATACFSVDVAQAQGRPDSLRMSCASARAFVSSRGAVVLGSGPNLYDRYVASQRFCLPDEITKPSWVPTRDTRQCFIGYRCERVDDDWPF